MAQPAVYPFILRGVSLLGLSATHCPMETRLMIWSRLGGEMTPATVDLVAGRTVALEDVMGAAEDVLGRRVRGRVVVDCRA